MKKLILFGLVAFLAIGLAGPPAGATTVLPPGEFTASVIDRSNLFSNQDDDPYLEPEGLTDPVNIGDEQRTILKVDAVNFGVKRVDLTDGTKYVSETGGTVDYTSGTLTGMLYDLEVGRILLDGDEVSTITVPDVGTEGPYTIEKARADRYRSNGTGTAGTWTDTVGAAADLIADNANGVDYGGLLVLYDDPARNIAFAGDGTGAIGPWDWREPGDLSGASPHPGQAVMEIPQGTTAAIDGGGVLTNADYYPTISDVPGSNTGVADSGTAEPWLVAVLLDLADIPANGIYPANPFGVGQGTYLLESNYIQGANGAVDFDGLGFANIIGGTAAGAFQWALGNFSIESGNTRWLADIRIEFEGENRGQLIDGWQIDSDDPAMFGVIPEPASMSLLGISLVAASGLFYRRKRK
jgi:hypothetical protein